MMIYWTNMNPMPMGTATDFDSTEQAADYLEQVRGRQQKWDTRYYRVHSGLVANANDIGFRLGGFGVIWGAGRMFRFLKANNTPALARLVRIIIEMRGLNFDEEFRVWNSCERKKGYCQSDAQREAERVSLLKSEDIAAYKCGNCGAWHIGHE